MAPIPEIFSKDRGELPALLIQGPLNFKILEQINISVDLFNNIVISSWNPSNLLEREIKRSILESIKKYPNVKIVLQNPKTNVRADFSEKFQLQIQSIQNGLKEINTNKLIKMRSDEIFKLEPFMNCVDSSTKTFQTCNFIIRNFSYHKYHISDHLFAGPTLSIKRSIKFLIETPPAKLRAVLGDDYYVPESLIGYALLNSTVNSTDESGVGGGMVEIKFQAFAQHFEVFNLDDLDYFEVRANSAGTGYISNLRNMNLETANRINFNYLKTTHSMSPNRIKSYYQRRLQPVIRQRYLAYRKKRNFKYG